MVVFILIYFSIFTILDINLYLSMLLAWIFALETRSANSKLVQKVITPFNIIGGISQYLLFTSKPTGRELKVAIDTIEELIDIEEKS